MLSTTSAEGFALQCYLVITEIDLQCRYNIPGGRSLSKIKMRAEGGLIVILASLSRSSSLNCATKNVSRLQIQRRLSQSPRLSRPAFRTKSRENDS